MEKTIMEQIEGLELQIKRESAVIARFESYPDSAIKSGVLYQTKGALRGLLAGKRSLEKVLAAMEVVK